MPCSSTINYILSDETTVQLLLEAPDEVLLQTVGPFLIYYTKMADFLYPPKIPCQSTRISLVRAKNRLNPTQTSRWIEIIPTKEFLGTFSD